MERELDYKKDMAIDPDALDVEWLRQTELGRKYAKHSAMLKKLQREAENRVKVVKAELVQLCNEFPLKHTGKEKPNLIDIESFYRTHPDHQKAKQEWIDATYEAEYAEMAQKEISYSRKASLENLVTLFTAQYFAGPVAPRNLSKEWATEKNRDAADDGINKAMKRKRP
jgi:hypothetical protein